MTDPDFHARFVELFDDQFRRLFRFLDRLSGDPDLAADLAQDTFIRLYRRGALPDAPQSWLITVALNLLRNDRSTRSRRRRLLTLTRGEAAHSDPTPPPDGAATGEALRERVRSALGTLPERDRQLLLLRAEGHSYHDIASALALNEASVGTLLARARSAFRASYGEPDES